MPGKHWTHVHREDWTAIEVGQNVCITGVGRANMVHVHHVVTKVTKTQIVSESREGVERRHMRADGNSPGSRGASSYGYTEIATTCQRPRPADRPAQEGK